MAITGLMSNLSLAKRNTFRPIIRAVTLAAGLGRLVVVRGSGGDRGNGIKRGQRPASRTGRRVWTMSTLSLRPLAATTTDGIIHFTRRCVFLSAWNSASSEAFSTVWFSVMLQLLLGKRKKKKKKRHWADNTQVMNSNFYSIILHLQTFQSCKL